MIFHLIAITLAPLLALQSAPAAADKPSSFADLPIEQATAPRCGVAFAIVQGWQNSGDPRGAQWPTIEDMQGREFFVVAMARLIDRHGLEQEDVTRLVQAELSRHSADNGEAVNAMMPACLALLEMTPQANARAITTNRALFSSGFRLSLEAWRSA